MTTKDLHDLLGLVAEDNLEDVISQMIKDDDKIFENFIEDVVTISAELTRINKQQKSNTIDSKDYQIQRNNIALSLIKTLKEVFDKRMALQAVQENISFSLAATEMDLRKIIEEELNEEGSDLKIKNVLSQGEDKYAIIYEAQEKWKTRTEKRVVKVFKTLSLIDEENDRLVQNDLEKISSISEKNSCLVTVYYKPKHMDAPPRYILTEFVKGEELEVKLKEKGKFSFSQTQKILDYLFEAVAEFHNVDQSGDKGEPLVHGNLRPSNILIEKRHHKFKPRLFPPKIIKGIFYKKICSKLLEYFQYWSPEQIEKDEVTPKSDQYSLGLIAYELLTGKPLFEGPNIQEVFRRRMKLEDDPDIIYRNLKKVRCPSDAIKVIQKMLNKDPGSRYDTLYDTLNAFDEIRQKDPA